MNFFEIDLFGVYVAPMAPMLIVAWLVMVPVRRLADRFGLLHHVWHPALFKFAVYVIVLASIVLLMANRGR